MLFVLSHRILVVEAEHDTWVRSAAYTEDGFPGPFYAPLDLSQVYTLASPFITSCPASNVVLPVKAFPTFKVDTAGPYVGGQNITIDVPQGGKYAAFVAAADTVYQPVSAGSVTITIPTNNSLGQQYLIITNTEAQNDNATVAGPVLVEVADQATNFNY